MNAGDCLDDDEYDDRFIRLRLFNAYLDTLGGRCRLCSEPIFVIVMVAELNHTTGQARHIPAALPFTSYMAWLNMDQSTLNPVGTWCEQCDDSPAAESHMRYMDDDAELLDMLMGPRLTTDDMIQLLEEKHDGK